MFKWLLRIAAILVGLIVLIVVAFAVFIFADAAFGPKVQDFANVSYPAKDGTTLFAYVAKPADAGPHPAVVMIHEFYGLNAAIVRQADALAQQGYVVIAPDTYRNQTTSQIPRAILLRVTVPEERVMQDVQAAFDYLKVHGDVDPKRIAVLGFCYGGEMALQHALRNPEIAATVVLYGSPVTDPQGLGALLQTKRPVLGIFAEQDAQIPPAEAQAFHTALDAAGIPNTVTVYPGVGHAFVQPESIAAGGAAREAWVQILTFLDANLKQKANTQESETVAQSSQTIADFRPRTLSTAAKFDVAYLCTVALSHFQAHRGTMGEHSSQ